MHWRRLDLAAVVARLPVRGVAVQTQAEGPIWADEDLLSAALMNLLDNAVRHRATEVTVRAEHLPDGLSLIRVQDNGDGVAALRAQQVNAALDAHQPAEVLGLGLTLTELVARTHGGGVVLVSASTADQQARGVEVQLTLGLPRSATPDAGPESVIDTIR